jgi:hypothetical protein
MKRLWLWITTHKLVTALLVIIGWLVFGQTGSLLTGISRTRSTSYSEYDMNAPFMSAPKGMALSNIGLSQEAAPTTDVSERMVVKNSTLSLKVKDVSDSIRKIIFYVENQGGYMVDSTVNNPEDAASGTITVRIPETVLGESLEYFRSLSVKVVSENLTGRDVTDQYQDIEERLRILEQNKKRFEEIMAIAVEIDDILNIQNQIFSVQNQIDSLKGQQQLLSQTAKLSKVTMYLATDELSLPYAPDRSWRPQVIFQTAVRSLLTNLQDIGSLIIWAGVYSAIWLPVLLIIIVIKKRKKQIRTIPENPLH